MEQKAKMSNFIKVEILLPKGGAHIGNEKEVDGRTLEYETSRASINPLSVSYYHPIKFGSGGKDYDVTAICSSGRIFWVNVPYEEFDNFFDEAERGFDMSIEG